jgi:ribose transport system permease protein
MSLGRSELLADARGGRLVRLVFETRELTLIILVLAIIAGMSLASPFFLSLANFRAIVIGMAPTAIIAIGMTVLLASGGFDLSVGSVLALSSTIAAFLLIMGVPIAPAIAAALVLGAIIGLANGIVVTKIGVNPLVATLGSMLIVRGIALVLTEGFSLSNLPPEFGWAGRAEVIGIPFVLWVTVLLVLVFDLAMRHGSFFRKIYYIGSN